MPTLTLFSSKLRDVVDRRVRMTGGGSSGDTYQSIRYEADGATGWVNVIAAKRRSAELDRFVVVVTEAHRAGSQSP